MKNKKVLTSSSVGSLGLLNNFLNHFNNNIYIYIKKQLKQVPYYKKKKNYFFIHRGTDNV